MTAIQTYTKAQMDALLSGKSDTSHTHTFASLTSKPTTVAGYGITDAGALIPLGTYTATTGDSVLSMATRNASGKSGNLFQSDFELYRAYVMQARPATNGASIRHRVLVAGVVDTNTRYTYTTLASVAGGIGGGGGGDVTLVSSINSWPMGNPAGHSASYWIDVVNPLGSLYKQITSTIMKAIDASDSRRIGSWFHGLYEHANAVSGIEMAMSSGNIDSLKVRWYGVL